MTLLRGSHHSVGNEPGELVPPEVAGDVGTVRVDLLAVRGHVRAIEVFDPDAFDHAMDAAESAVIPG
jgi:hypothetical protein